MIKSWTDDKGVRRYADEHSKAYRNRTEAKPEEAEAVEQTVETTPDAKSRRPVVKTPEAPREG